MKRDTLNLDVNDHPTETSHEFDERTGCKLHVFPADPCIECSFHLFAVITHGFPNAGESWCLKCAADYEE